MLGTMPEAFVATAIRLSPEHMQRKDGIHYFAVDVFEDSKAWRVWRRYNDFWYLKAQLGRLSGSRFPRRALLNCFKGA